jgi:mono/diheme cytochrome c family protein
MTGTGRVRAALVAGVVAVALAGCGGDDDDGGATPTPAAGGETAAADGEALFKQRCATCHTLAAAGASGAVGPNLDDVKPDVARVQQAIKTAPGVMPENLASGAEAQAIAEYVAGAAGS